MFLAILAEIKIIFFLLAGCKQRANRAVFFFFRAVEIINDRKLLHRRPAPVKWDISDQIVLFLNINTFLKTLSAVNELRLSSFVRYLSAVALLPSCS